MNIKIGDKFGKLTILKHVYNNNVQHAKNSYYLVKCACGHEFLLRKDYLKTRTQCPKCSRKPCSRKPCNRKQKTLRQQLNDAFVSNNTIEQDSLIFAICITCISKIEQYFNAHNIDAMLKVIPETLDK